MAQSGEGQLEQNVGLLLGSSGWQDVLIERVKVLARPFHTDDTGMLDCYNAAGQNGGAIVIYSDPILD